MAAAGVAEIMDPDDEEPCLLRVIDVPSSDFALAHRPRVPSLEDISAFLRVFFDEGRDPLEDRITAVGNRRLHRPVDGMAFPAFGGYRVVDEDPPVVDILPFKAVKLAHAKTI